MKPKTFAVELTEPHTHAGEDLLPGVVLTLPIPKAEWLMQHRIAKPYQKPVRPEPVEGHQNQED